VSERKRIGSGAQLEGRYGYCRAIVVGERVLVSGTAPIWPDGECSPDPAVQARRCLEIIATALEAAGATMAEVVRTRMYVTDAAFQEPVGAAHAEAFAPAPPATSMVVVAGLLDPRWKVEIEAEAVKAST
jgi:enamine deaminase RidA (YjgF/YER057c/UK114 family)